MRNVLLLALLLTGLMGSAQTSITNGNCKAQFKYAVNTQIMTLMPATAINFFDRSEGKVKQWYWDFGDGNTSNEQNPLHIFNHPIVEPNVKIDPYRTVSLTILTDSCKSFYSEVINIMDGTPYVNPVCKAGFKYYQTAYDSIEGTATVQLTNLSEGDSLKYLWQFDNGKTSTEKEPIVTFSIKQTENKVCLTVTGTNQCTDSFCDAVYIVKPIINPIDPKLTECQTYFGYSINYTIKTFAPALVLDFYTKTFPEAVEWKWDFGDGSTSNEPNPTHIFNLPILISDTQPLPSGDRKVSLTVKTATGCVATWNEVINIYMKEIPKEDPAINCHAWFKYSKVTDIINIPEVVAYRLMDVSEGNVEKRLWHFEDGTTSTEKEPLVTFSIFKPTQKVCLDIYTTESCTSTWCETLYISNIAPDTTYVTKPACSYTMRYLASFPIQMSSCAGYAKAQVYLKDSFIQADHYVWSTGAEGQEVKGLCPTRTYSVKAITADGCIVSGTFIFNSNGTVTEIPINWWISGTSGNQLVQYNVNNTNYTVEWRLCDGTIVKGDSTSIPLNSINCGAEDSNLILKDAAGNIVYTENISMKALLTYIDPKPVIASLKLFPNPVNDVLNIQYSGNSLNEMQIEIFDLTGKLVSNQKFYHVESRQQISLNVNALRKGMYFCKMIADQKIMGTEKFSK